VNGLLVPPGDVDAFGSALLRFEDTALRGAFGMAGRRRADAFTLDRMVDLTLATYSEALNAPR
jgi:glycosyltransferase involved in cell wall biosynthesis